MMWNRYGLPVAIIGVGLAASVVSAEVSFAARSRDYTPGELRAILRGFGYNVTLGDTLRDEATRTAIRQFQQGYTVPVDGVAVPVTQNLAANLVKILKANLNLVLQPSPALPINQFWDAKTEAAVKRYQQSSNLSETGIANLQLRQKLDTEAERILNQSSPTPTPTPTPTPRPTPTPSPSPSPRPSPSPSPRPSPSPSPRPSPSPSPRPSPSASPSPSPAPSPSPSPQTNPPSSR